MARKRYITSDISIDEAVAAVANENPTAALMWPWFIKELDDWGRMTGSPLKIKLQVFQAFQFTIDDIKVAISLFAKHGLVHAYEAKGIQYLAVNPDTFYKHQPYIHKSKRHDDKSSIPAPIDAPWLDVSRNIAEHRGDSRKIVPSPSPSPSPSQDNNDHDPAPAPARTEIFSTFEKEFGRPLSPLEYGQITQWEKEFSLALILEALKRAVLGGKHNFKYINSILLEWHRNNVQTIQAVREYDDVFKARKEGQARARDGPRTPGKAFSMKEWVEND
jgi:DnaD/phage-associated family protein